MIIISIRKELLLWRHERSQHSEFLKSILIRTLGVENIDMRCDSWNILSITDSFIDIVD